MKKKLLFILLSGLLINTSFAQKDKDAETLKNIQQVPAFKITVVPDSSAYTNDDIQKNKPFILMFFNPDCEHCQKETKELIAYKEELKDIPILMVSALPYPIIRTFYIDYSMMQMPNVKMGYDEKYALGLKYLPGRYPAIYVYDSKGNLAKAFAGNVGVPAILEALK